MSLLAELRRRNVVRVTVLHIVAGWVLLQAGDLLFGVLCVPAWAMRLLLGMLLLGLPGAVLFGWIYELTPVRAQAHERERPRAVDRNGVPHETRLDHDWAAAAIESFERSGRGINILDNYIWWPVNAKLRADPKFRNLIRRLKFDQLWRVRGWPEACHPFGDDFSCS